MRTTLRRILILVLVGASVAAAVATGPSRATLGGASFAEAISRSFTVTNEALNPPTFAESVSRSFTVTNEALNPPTFSESISRSFTVTNEALNPSTFAESISRSFTVTNEALNPPTYAESISRSFTVTNEALNPPTFAESISRSFTVCNAAGDPPPDEDEDGVPDCLDQCPGSPDGEDCDDDGIPDGCETDCDGNGVPDDCDIADCTGDPACDDCDADGILDICELPPIGSGEADCNENGIPDQCDIANCPPGELTCNDCNLNGVPDFCDDPDDSIPDECIEYNGGCEKDDNSWTCAENWEGDIVPDNTKDLNFSVTLAGIEDDVFLDDDITIDTLRILNDAALSVTQVDVGDFTVVEPGGILIEGNLLVANNRLIDVTAGMVTIGPGGVYQADPDAKGSVTATLEAGAITVSSGPLEDGGGGSMILAGSMEVVSTGDLHLNNDDGGKGCDTPPDLEMIADAAMAIGGDFVITNGACVGQNSSQAVSLEGDFDNRSLDADNFEWFDVAGPGELRMNGTAQTIEAAGEDRGPWLIGLVDNFAFRTLTLGAGAVVEVDDTFDNQQDGVVACDEALYVGHLIVEPGAVLLTDGCRVYYIELTNDGAVPDLGVHVLQIGESSIPDLNCDGEVGAFDLALLLAGWGGCAQPCEADEFPPACPGDSDGGGIGPFDLASLLAAWGSVPQ